MYGKPGKIAETAVEYLVKNGRSKIGYVGDCRSESRFALLLDRIKGGQSTVTKPEAVGTLVRRESVRSVNEQNEPEYII